MSKSDSSASKKERNKTVSWVVTIFFVTILVSGTISFASDAIMAGSSMLVAFVILLAIILIGIVFDVIGVAVTSADEKPFHSMAARKVPGAQESIRLLRKAERVSSICNDVVGDICGIVSGTTGAVIVLEIQQKFGLRALFVSIVVTALISGLTIGGKAVGKEIAMKKSKQVVYFVAKLIPSRLLGKKK